MSELPKLVRDCIPKIIEETGSTCKFSYVSNHEEHTGLLRDKILEETDEFIANPSYGEAADMVEVIKAFCHLNDLKWDSVLEAADNKEKSRGGFYTGIVLEYVDYRMNDV